MSNNCFVLALKAKMHVHRVRTRVASIHELPRRVVFSDTGLPMYPVSRQFGFQGKGSRKLEHSVYASSSKRHALLQGFRSVGEEVE
jgi:hypothetical protein